MTTRLLVLLVGFLALFWCIGRWRQAIKLAMVLVILEGAIRKWLLPGAQDLVYFGKDVMLIGAYLGFLNDPEASKKLSPPPQALSAILMAAVGLGAIQVFNPNLPSILLGLFGFKAYFLYAPLLYILPAVFRDDRDVATYLRRYLWVAIPVGLLAVTQFFSPRSSVINTYARGDGIDIAGFGGAADHVRVTGTFSFIGGYSGYLLASSILILAVLATTRWNFRRERLIYVALGLNFLGLLMTGSRGPLFMMFLLFPLYWLLLVARQGSGTSTGRIVVAMGIVLTAAAYFNPDAVEAFVGRAMNATDTESRIFDPFLLPFRVIPTAGLFGYGIGATHQAANSIVGGWGHWWLPHGAIEVEGGRIVMELGPIGFLLIYGIRFALVGYALSRAVRLEATFHRALATGTLLFTLALLPGGPIFDPTGSLFFWFMAGLTPLAERLERDAKRSRQAAALQRDTPSTSRRTNRAGRGPVRARPTLAPAPGLAPS